MQGQRRAWPLEQAGAAWLLGALTEFGKNRTLRRVCERVVRPVSTRSGLSVAAKSGLEWIDPAGAKSCLAFFAYAGERFIPTHFCFDSAYASPAISAAIA